VNSTRKPMTLKILEIQVTAATSSSLNDGAAAMLLMAECKAAELGLSVKARIRSYADAEQA